jgi:hypothetical protein
MKTEYVANRSKAMINQFKELWAEMRTMHPSCWGIPTILFGIVCFLIYMVLHG